MATLGASPFAWLPFDETGKIREDWPTDALAGLKTAVGAPGVTDLVVLSHGWQNDLEDAEKLYGTLWGNVCAELAQRGIDPAHFLVAGVLWPAKKWDADYDGAHALDVQQEASNTKSVDDGGEGDAPGLPVDIDEDKFEDYLATLSGFVGQAKAARVVAAARAVSKATDPDTAKELFDSAREALDFGAPTKGPDKELETEANWSDGTENADKAWKRLTPFTGFFTAPVDPEAGTTLGLGAALGSLWAGPRNGALWVLNKLTYYTMKKRAGIVGDALAQNVLGPLTVHASLRIHFVGHSFGGRLVTAAAHSLVVPAGAKLGAVVLLQGAYSHNGLTAAGPFGSLVGEPEGPIVFTHTHNDLACTVAYPLASRVVLDTTLSLGDADDPFGAMGANGPQGVAADKIAVCDPVTLPLQPGIINTVLADAFVIKTATSDAHNNVTNPRCGAIVAAALCCR